ncbi:hemolysin III family protein [Piscinibacter sp. HJYY11]|uniref:PAQR family membrane homeostasis protein TrhA n=1 Tax=Piscinibacter sp. HJYY11 TaxID=2801333 RepID=UPI00191FDB9F|nr:hemolysin III family protein [Piscinibacter sp. HJYY11]MBL0726231.1 hemolysin III family protein [Piscinibacter sp. HJYY11]
MSSLHDDDDERASSAVHAVAFLLSAVLLAYVVDLVPSHSPTRAKLQLFAAVMVLMYLASALLHACTPGVLKDALERLDHAMIYLFIASTYSLFEAQPQGIGGVVWALAIGGAVVSIVRRAVQTTWSALPYVLLGWLAVAGIAWQASLLSDATLCLLVVGAAIYTIGVRSYLASGRRKFAHAEWHLLVVLGSVTHTTAALVDRW